MDDRGQRPAERHLALDALGHQFVLGEDVVLKYRSFENDLASPRPCMAPSDPIPR